MWEEHSLSTSSVWRWHSRFYQVITTDSLDIAIERNVGLPLTKKKLCKISSAPMANCKNGRNIWICLLVRILILPENENRKTALVSLFFPEQNNWCDGIALLLSSSLCSLFEVFVQKDAQLTFTPLLTVDVISFNHESWMSQRVNDWRRVARKWMIGPLKGKR